VQPLPSGGLREARRAGSNVSTEPSLKSLTNPLRDSIRELRVGYQSMSECLELTMAECDLRAVELEDCHRKLVHARRSLGECQQQLAARGAADAEIANRCAAQANELGAKQLQLTQALEQLGQAQAESARATERLEFQVEQNQQLRRQFEQAETEREALRGDMAQLRSQFGPLAESVTDSASLRTALVAAQGELAQLREQLAAPRPDGLLQEQLAAADLQRQQLESELDALRHRGAELAEALAEQKQAVGQEREQWNDELRQLRRAVEKQSEVLARRAVAPAAVAAAEQPAVRPAAGAKEDNRVVGSVLAQFETLQKNKVRKVANS
jgi:chromosome segregation ATPase